MKRIHILLGALLCFCMIETSCEKAPFLTLSTPKSINFTEQGGSQSISFSANRAWSVSSSDSWCKVTPSSGIKMDGEITVTLTCEPNTTYDSRSTTLTINVEDLIETITVSQSTNYGLLVSPNSFDLSNAAQMIEVEVQSNVNYSVTVDSLCKDWITQTGTKALSTEKISFSILANDTYDNREGKIIIKQTDGPLSETITIKQHQTDALFITTPEYNLSNESHTLSVEVQHNVSFEVNPEVNWIHYVETKALNTSTITLSIDANDTYDARTGIVSVKSSNGNLKGTITVNQSENYGLFVSPETLQLSKDAQTVSVEVSYNVDYDVIIPESASGWITQKVSPKTRGLEKETVVFNISENTTYDEREAAIAFKQKGGSLTGTVKIVQGSGVIDLSEAGLAYCYIITEAGKYKFTFNTNEYEGVNSAFLMWNENGANDITDVVFKNDCVYFTKAKFNKGNALISIANDGTVLWSWHIWSTDKPSFVDGIMDRNLGATDTQPNSDDSYGLVFCYGCPFPFPGAKYSEWILTSEPSVPEGWYVAPGYGFYSEDKMPTPDKPMMHCSNYMKYGNSIYWRYGYKLGPYGVNNVSHTEFENLIGYEPSFNGLNGVLIKEGLFIPAAGRRHPNQIMYEVDRNGNYWGRGTYNYNAVDGRAIWFNEGFGQYKLYFEGNWLASVRSREW